MKDIWREKQLLGQVLRSINSCSSSLSLPTECTMRSGVQSKDHYLCRMAIISSVHNATINKAQKFNRQHRMVFSKIHSFILTNAYCLFNFVLGLSRWRRQWHPTPVLLPGKSHGWRSLVGCSPWGCEESDTTEWLHFHFSLSCIGEDNGNPLQCSCLENPRMAEPGGLPSMGSHRVGHDWSDLAAAAAAGLSRSWNFPQKKGVPELRPDIWSLPGR